MKKFHRKGLMKKCYHPGEGIGLKFIRGSYKRDYAKVIFLKQRVVNPVLGPFTNMETLIVQGRRRGWK